jgi:hypothetical protein
MAAWRRIARAANNNQPADAAEFAQVAKFWS